MFFFVYNQIKPFEIDLEICLESHIESQIPGYQMTSCFDISSFVNGRKKILPLYVVFFLVDFKTPENTFLAIVKGKM